MNNFNAFGRLVADPELSQSKTGKSYVKFRVAIDRGFKDANGQRQSDFVNFSAWDKTAEFICRYFKKGQMIGLSAQFRTNNWTDQNGQKRYDYYFEVREAYFGGDKAQDNSQDYAAPQGISNDTPITGGMSYIPNSYTNPGAQMPNFQDVQDDSDLPF